MRRKPNPYPSLVFLIFLTRFAIGDDATVMDNFSKSLTPTPSTWKKGSNFCTGWEGVKCDSSGHVTSIDLQNKGLSGSLPSDLNQLAQLQQLSLQKNQLSGPLPSFSDLTNLADIFLANNNFTSVPPSAFSGLSGLKTLSLSNNVNLDPWLFPGDLTGSDQLEMVDASNVNLFGPLPDIFDKFSSLQSLRLSYNNLTGFLPATFANSPIRNLTLNNQVNRLSGRIDVIGKMSQLSQVWLHVNAFSGPIPDLSNCTSLSDFRVRDNQLTGLVPSSLTTNPGLVHAEISNNYLQGPLPVFGKQVTTDVITQNNFCDTKPGPCDPRVTTLLDIAGALGYPMSIAHAWSGNDPCKDWDYLTCDTDGNITVINFSKQKFGGFISPAFSNLTKLKNMMLNDNNLTGSIPSSLTSLTALQVLDVSNNNLSGKVPTFPTGVIVKIQGNTLIGKDVPSGGGDGSGGSGGPSGSNGSEGSASGKSGHSSLSSGLIAGIIILVVLIVCVTCLVSYRIYKKKHSKEFDLVKNPQNGNGKQVVSNGSSGIKMNGYDGVGHELLSQSSDDRSDVQFFEGGNVVISFEVLRQVTDNFSEHKILGRGGFGVVYKGELHDGTQIAVKRMESGIMGTKGLKEFQAEIAVLTKVRHRHLVALLGFCTNGNEKLLVYEHMPQGTLSQHLFEWRELGYKPLTWKQRVTIALDVARGVEYLHSLAQQSFIHRDLKPSNILLGDDMRAKVADFGLVKNAPDGKYSVETKLAGTFGYLAPEYAVTGRVTTKVDVYAFGVVLMELVTGRKALDETMPEDRSHLVTWFRRVLINKNDTKKCIDPTLDPDDETSEIICKVAELAGHCTSREPSQRPDMGHAVNILAPLVQQWKPTTEELDDSFGIDFQMSLPQALERWQSREGTSTMVGDTYHGRTISLGDTQSSIPSMLEGFPNTMGSTDAR